MTTPAVSKALAPQTRIVKAANIGVMTVWLNPNWPVIFFYLHQSFKRMAFLTRQFIPPVARQAVESRWAHTSRPAPRHARGHIGQPRGHRAFLGISLAT